jgi:hypothetical protein
MSGLLPATTDRGEDAAPTASIPNEACASAIFHLSAALASLA